MYQNIDEQKRTKLSHRRGKSFNQKWHWTKWRLGIWRVIITLFSHCYQPPHVQLLVHTSHSSIIYCEANILTPHEETGSRKCHKSDDHSWLGQEVCHCSTHSRRTDWLIHIHFTNIYIHIYTHQLYIVAFYIYLYKNFSFLHRVSKSSLVSFLFALYIYFDHVTVIISFYI